MRYFNDSVVFDNVHFNVFSEIREAWDFDTDKNDKLHDGIVISTGQSRLQTTITPADARAFIVMLNRYLEATAENTLALQGQTEKAAA